MPLFFVPMLGLRGIGIAMILRLAAASPDAVREDTATRLLRWAVGLLSPARAEWGRLTRQRFQPGANGRPATSTCPSGSRPRPYGRHCGTLPPWRTICR